MSNDKLVTIFVYFPLILIMPRNNLNVTQITDFLYEVKVSVIKLKTIANAINSEVLINQKSYLFQRRYCQTQFNLYSTFNIRIL